MQLDLETRNVQTHVLGEATKLTGSSDQSSAAVIAEAVTSEARLHQSLRKQRGLTLRLDLINKCNLRCTMCAFSDEEVFRRPTRQLTFEQFRAMFDELGPHVREVMLSCGDEPLLARNLPEILTFLRSEHPEIETGFCTNATLLRAKIRRIIIESGVASLLFSIDAVTKDLFERIRVGAKYESVIANILALRDLKIQSGAQRRRFVFNYVLMKQNIHEAPAFVAMAKELGGAVIDFRHVVPMFSGYDLEQELSAHPAKFNFYRNQIVEEAARAGIEIYLPAAFVLEEGQTFNSRFAKPGPSLDKFFQVAADPAQDQFPTAVPQGDLSAMRRYFAGCAADEFSTTFCNWPFSELMVRDQDEVLPCPWYARPLGRLSEGKSLSDIFFGNDFSRLRENMLKSNGDPGCSNCPIKAGQLPLGS